MRDDQKLGRRVLLQTACFGAAFGALDAWAQAPPNNFNKPVYRVAKKAQPAPPAAAHPLDPALKMAADGLRYSQKNIRDYTAKLVKRERINGKVGQVEYMNAKIRNRKVGPDGRIVVPFAVYLKFTGPKSVKNREVLFVEGKNNGKMLAKEGGTAGGFLPSVWLLPTGALAMRGQLHPLTEIGIENLMLKLIERGNREKKLPGCEVKFHKGYKVNDRLCTRLELKHPIKRPEFEFFVAEIFIDDQLGIPIRYAAYDWPKRGSTKPEVIEEYTYLNLKVNVGLDEMAFNYKNPAYNF